MGKTFDFSAHFTFKFVGWLAISARGSHKKLLFSGTNLKIKHVPQSNVFFILFLHFVCMPGTVTRTVIGSSIPRFQYVNTFQARKQMSFHRQAPWKKSPPP